MTTGYVVPVGPGRMASMGAWGTGPFDNDGAADWAGDVDEAEDVPAFLAETFRGGSDDEPDHDDASGVLAAAAWLASALPGGPAVDPAYGPSRVPESPTPELCAAALAALDRTTAPGSEWHELWSEGGQLAEAEALLQPIRAVLGSAAAR
jgi:uncharacterized protein DUF4259